MARGIEVPTISVHYHILIIQNTHPNRCVHTYPPTDTQTAMYLLWGHRQCGIALL